MPTFLRLSAVIVCTAWLLTSCQTELPLPGGSSEQKIVLLGELLAGDTVLIRAGQSTPISAGASGPSLIQNLAINIQDGTGNTINLLGREDHLSYSLSTLAYSSPQRIQAGTLYNMQGTHAQLGTVTAAVRIPGTYTATFTERGFGIYQGDSVLSLDVDINDAAASDAQYVIEAVRQEVAIYGYFYFNGSEYLIRDYRTLYDSLKAVHVPVSERYDTSYSGTYSRQQLYTSDALSENLAGGLSGRLFRRIFLPGKAFGGTSHQTRIMLPRAALYSEYGQQAQTLIHVKSVSADYYEFLKAYEQYDPSIGLGGNAAPAKLEGNVTGGFGMVGGVYRRSYGMIH